MDNGFDDWGGYMEAKITKLEEQYDTACNPFRETNLFAGISIFVNGLTEPSADELKRIMMVHGGTYHHYQRSHTTYIITSNLPDVKIRNMNTSKVISPQWIVDCLKEEKILDYTKYLLYTNHKVSQPKINFSKITNHNNIDTKNNNLSKENGMKDFNYLENNSSVELGTKILETNSHSPFERFYCDDDEIQNDEIINSSQETPKRKKPFLSFKKESSSVSHSPTPAPPPPPPKTTTVAKTAVDPEFLSEFYNNSRLHHISTLGAGFKQYISDLRENHSGEFPKRSAIIEKLKKLEENFTTTKTTVMHIDMDCFFVSVGLRSYPELRGQPVAVTHSKGGAGNTSQAPRPGVDRQLEMNLYMKRLNEKFHDNVMDNKKDKIQNGFDGNNSLSEIASCSYEARKMGVKNGMFVGQALKLCPNLKTIPYDFEGYKEVAYTLYDTIVQYTLNIEAVSCDEMFVDLTDLLNDTEVDTMQLVEFIRNEVKNKTNCPCSAGIGGNRLQARMATKNAKPDGQFFLNSNEAEEYMKNILISDLPGVGHSTTHSLKKIDCNTCGDLQKIPLSKLQNELGKKFGERLYQFCRGIDNRPLSYGQIRKSVSAEVNYGIRFTEYSELEKFLDQLCTEVHSRLIKIKRKGKCITLKIMQRSFDAPIETAKFMGHGFCDYLTKSISLSDYTDNLEIIIKNVQSTMKSLNIPPKELRGIGIQITKLNVPPNNQEIKNHKKEHNDIKLLFNKAFQKQNINKSSTPKTDDKKVNTLEMIPKGNIKVSPNGKIVKNQLKSPPQQQQQKMSIKKSPIKRNRGKQPTKLNEKNLKMPNIVNMFQNCINKKSNSLQIEEIDGIDREVFAELPEDIKQEILNDYKKTKMFENNKKKSITKESNNNASTSSSSAAATTTSEIVEKSKIMVGIEFLNALPSPLRKEVEKEIAMQENKIIITKNKNETKLNGSILSQKMSKNNKKINLINKKQQISDNNIFIQSNWDELITAWVESSDVPECYDIELVISNTCELISVKNIYDLYDPLVRLKSLISEKSCNWHKAYRRIIEEIQLKMLTVYGSKLFLKDDVNCDKCNTK